MTNEILDPAVRESLRDHVESHATGGDFDTVWNQAQRQSRSGRSMGWVAPVALAAIAVLVLGLPARQAYRAHQGGAVAAPSLSAERAGDWVEPFALRYPTPVPMKDAAPFVREAMTKGSRGGNDPWSEALDHTPKGNRWEIHERRALVGLVEGDMDVARDEGMAAGTPVGLLLAGEVHIVDLEPELALPLLESVKHDPRVGATATLYLQLFSRGRAAQGLAEVSALALLGDLPDACRHLAEVWPDNGEAEHVLARKLAPVMATCDVPGFAP